MRRWSDGGGADGGKEDVTAGHQKKVSSNGKKSPAKEREMSCEEKKAGCKGKN